MNTWMDRDRGIVGSAVRSASLSSSAACGKPLAVAVLAKPRNKRQVPAQKDIQQVLQEKSEQGARLLTVIAQVLNASYDQDPALEFLEENQGIPKVVREEAVRHRAGLGAYLDYLIKVRSVAEAWTSNVRAALADAERTDDHRFVAPTTDWLSLIGADPAAQIRSAVEQLEPNDRHGIALASGLADFLAEQRAHLSAKYDIGQCYTPVGDGIADSKVPESLRSLNSDGAYSAKWDIQARLFQFGKPLWHNLNLRRFTFSDGSHADIQAHQPVLAHSEVSNAVLGLVGLATGAGFALLGAAGGPVGAAVMGAVGFSLGASLFGAFRLRDAAWQGYTASYYRESDPYKPWGVREFYGWRNADKPLTSLQAQARLDSARFCNFADNPEAHSWWQWRLGGAAARGAAFDGSGQKEDRGDGQATLLARANQLVQALAAFVPASGAGQVLSQPAVALVAHSLLAAPQQA